MSRPKHSSASNFAALLQEFFVERLMQQRAVSPQTIASYRDTFRLFLHRSGASAQATRRPGAHGHRREARAGVPSSSEGRPT